MRLTNREKYMLIGLFVIAMLSFVIYYVYLPVYDELQIEKDALLKNSVVLETIEKNILPLEEQRRLIDAFRQKVGIMNKALPPVLYQENILRTMTGIFSENNVNVDNYTFELERTETNKDANQESLDKILSGYNDTILDNLSKSMVEARFENANKQAEEAASNKWDSLVKTIDVSISVNGEYENIKQAISDFESLDNLVIVNSLTVAKDVDYKNIVSGTMSLRFPYYYDNETLEKLDWLYESDFKEHLPFDYIIKGSNADPDRPIRNVSTTSNVGDIFNGNFNGLSGSESITGLYDREAEESKILNSDFEIVISAPTSINAPYFISKGDARQLSLSTPRERENETLTLTVTEVGGKFAFNYSNSFQSFPKVNEFYSFIPNYEDGIYMNVVSSPRVDNSDVGMGTLNVYNKTTKPVKIIVNTDDERLPRFKMGTTEGEVTMVHN